MTLDEAIKHCEEVANGMTEQGKCEECAAEHRQLAEWLKELKNARETLKAMHGRIGYPRGGGGKMTREEAIDILDDNFTVIDTHGHYTNEEVEQARQTAIEALEREKKWIPVSEKLPKDGKWALFTDGSNMSVERYKNDAIDHFFPQERWFSFDKAIAWMPLPEPYKAESEEGMKIQEDFDKEEISKAVALLDLFTKTFCRYKYDYERFGDLKFRCDKCPFQKANGDCLAKLFKNKYAPDYRDFGSMGDL